MDLKQAIEIIEGGAWCSLRFITADLKKGSGGQVIEFAKCRIARNRNKLATKVIPRTPDATAIRRDPAHNYNFTRNMELPNTQMRKVHPILITHLNQQEIL